MIDTSTAASAVSLESAKAHLRVEHTADDVLIESLCQAVTQMCEQELQHGIVSREGVVGYADSVEAVPAAIRQWVLLHVGTYYENRAHAAPSELKTLPFVSALLDPYRIWGPDDESSSNR